MSFSARLLSVSLLVAIFAVGFAAVDSPRSVMAQQDDETSEGTSALVKSSNESLAASPAAFPLHETHFVGSVMYKRTVGFERFDTDHDIDGSGGEDREIFGSHYVWEDTFRVRIQSSYADKPENVFGVGFSGVSGGVGFPARAVGGVVA